VDFLCLQALEEQTIMNENNDKLVRAYLLEPGVSPHEVLRGQPVDRGGGGGHSSGRA